MKKCFLILPNHLGEEIPFSQDSFIIEEPILFTGHKLKVAMMRSVLLDYKKGKKLIDCKDVNNFLKELPTKYDFIEIYDPLDYTIEDKYRKIFKNKLVILPLCKLC